jgi:hypothetical protein
MSRFVYKINVTDSLRDIAFTISISEQYLIRSITTLFKSLTNYNKIAFEKNAMPPHGSNFIAVHQRTRK